MKKFAILLIALFFGALCLNVFAQEKTYPFVVKKSGQGKQSVILIPGFACSGDVWNETCSVLNESFTCHVLTMAGFAGVDPKKNPSFENWEQGIVEYLRDQQLGKVIVIGHSMGGGLALALAADYSDLIEKIVVVDALPCLGALMDPDYKAEKNPHCRLITKRMKQMSEEKFYEMQVNSMSRLMEDTLMRETAIGWSIDSDRETFAEMYCSFSNTDLRNRIKNVKCESLILLESEFTNFKPAVEEQYAFLQGADLRYASRGLHFIMYDDRDWYFKQIRDFLGMIE